MVSIESFIPKKLLIVRGALEGRMQMDSILNSRIFLVIIILLFSSQLFIPQGKSISIENIEITIPGQQPRLVENTPIIVAGIWHYINFSIIDSQSDSVNLVLYKSNEPPSQSNRNENTYYEWEYNAGKWFEPTEYGDGKYSYINSTNCQKNENTYNFYIGIKSDIISNSNLDEIDTETWMLEINSDETQIKKTEIIIEEPVIGFAQKSAEFYLRCEPFIVTEIQPDHTFGVINRFNVPIRLQLSYTQFSENIQTTNTNAIIHPNSTSSHALIINTPEWPPGIVTIEGIIGAIPLYTVQTGDVYLRSTPTQNFPLILINVGHENYKIFEPTDSEIVFQYEEELDVPYNSIKNITVYISGNGNLSINAISAENCSLLNSFYQDAQIQTFPLPIISTNTSEIYINTRTHFNQSNTIAYLNYNLEIADKTYTFQTKINVGEYTPQTQESTNSIIPLAIVGICLAIVIIYIIFNQIKSGRR